jgi:hypothetical protein
VPSPGRRRLLTRHLPAACGALLGLRPLAPWAQTLRPVEMSTSLAEDLDFVRRAFAQLTYSRRTAHVMRWLAASPHRAQRTEQADWGVAYQVQHGVVAELHITTVSPAPDPQVAALTAQFKPGRVRLGDLEASFGPWYRDPPDGDQASLASAYFNARLIHPSADFLLVAGTGAGYGRTLSRDEPADFLAATWADDRAVRQGRPW